MLGLYGKPTPLAHKKEPIDNCCWKTQKSTTKIKATVTIKKEEKGEKAIG